MPENKTQRTYIFDARRATSSSPEVKRYCCSLLPVLARHLKDNEHLNILTSQEEVLSELDKFAKTTLHCIPVKPGSIFSRMLAHRIIRKTKPCLYHSATIMDPFPSRIRSIATIHRNCPMNRDASRSSLFSSLVFRFLTRQRLKRCETYISISRTLLATYAATVVPARSHIIPYGVNPAFRPMPEEEVEKAREKYSLPRRFLLMIMAGENTRNIATVLEALQTTDFTESAPLVIAGYCSRCESITKMIKQRGLSSRVLQTGPIDDTAMPALYNAAYALLFPNIIRGTGLPVMEAMACGTPVICSSLPVLVELVAGAATLVHPTDKIEWCRAMNTALLSINWHEEYRDAALNRARSFSWDKAAEETLKVYRSMN